jgi:hypothetical protein
MAYRNKSRELHWRGVLKEQSSSGLSVAAFCRQESISPPSFYAWRRKFRDRNSPRAKRSGSSKLARTDHNTGNGPQLLPVRIEGTASTLRIHLPRQGVFVEVPHGTDRETVAGVLQALREAASC